MNDSGIYPLLDRVLVLPDEIEDTTEGGIIIAQQVKEQHQMAQATGTLIAVGPDAFTHSRVEVYNPDGSMKELRIERWNPEHVPKEGDRVIFAKYGGLETKGSDGKKYRVMNDRDITAGADHGVTYDGIESRKPMGAQ